MRLNFISVVIATRHADEAKIKRCIKSVRNQSYPKQRYEVIVVSPQSGEAGASAQRNFGVKNAKGSIIAFIDDDAEADDDWLSQLSKCFVEPDVAVVGGPNLTPKDDPYMAKVGGYVFYSFIGSASMTTRYLPYMFDGIRDASESDIILCNMAVRKSVFDEVGGFDTRFYPNEENVFCYNVQQRGYKIKYTPFAIVWHRRRPLFIPFIHQVFNYGRGRGQMCRFFPRSTKTLHLLPTIFLLWLLTGMFTPLRDIYVASIVLYLAACLFSAVEWATKTHDPKLLFLLPIAYFLHHISYGLGFLYGAIRS